MTDKAKDTVTHRRDFLKFAGTGVVAGGAAMVSGTVTAQAADTKGDSGKAAGYRETEHVRRYYQLAR